MSTITFHCIFRSKYIRQMIFNHINDISKQLYQRSLVGRDIIKLPLLEMISIYAVPWDFIRHYLPTDIDQIQLKGVISKYCCHDNATLDKVKHLLEWSHVDFDWDLFKSNDFHLVFRSGIIMHTGGSRFISSSASIADHFNNYTISFIRSLVSSITTTDMDIISFYS
ncbi:hypothetical protein DFA_07472 [Cavenderia fasciculata]|uniref:Uncharacterized protein n=1 Tax=Cavenderia fasciculata TaxID=261658 RepID=F4PWI4_CACFS|nr:uncharacterized protein DFA_07472 [Cavenderia fasciculata]EGG20348.1 hypothetical protein DFA_07472 [Cavenderia fasciculata]|eukprot:XP_004367331.1 hypothetical protein DFA_07472 [Cavenderia fasciculata]